MNTNAKRKNRTANNRGPRNKPTVDRNMVDGIYNNGRFMHTAASLVGCLVQVLTTNGSLFEGIFRTFSQQFEVVIELAHKLDRTHPKLPSKDTIIDKLIFKIADVVNITCYNTDMEYATKDSFATDTSISKFNGQIQEKELEPWEGASGEGDELPALDSENANGWDANEMFRTNEQQYGVQSTYEPTLAGYTTPLERKNTEEFKKQEAKASKIASEIENSPTYKKRNDMENGDEEERFSAVVRADSNLRPDSNTQKYVPPAKRKNPQTGKLTRTALPPVQNSYGNVSTVKSHPPGHMQHSSHIPSSSHNAHGNPHMQSPPVQHSQPPGGIHAPTHYGPPQQPSSMNSVINSSPHQSSSPPQVALHPPPQPPKLASSSSSSESEPKVNGEKIDKEEKKTNKSNEITAAVEAKDLETKVLPEVSSAPHIGNKIDRKNSNPKARDEQIAELKKFSSDFKLTDENKDDKPESTEQKDKIETEVEKASNAMKKSTLNPNAKEFVLNPNAKSFTPRSPSTQTPTPPRPQTPSTVMAQPPGMSMMPPHHIFSGLAPHQYMMPAPVSGVLTPQFNPATTMQPASRIRKGAYIPASVHQQRHEFSQVAAATGQPILAPPSLPTHHIPVTVQYPQGMVPNPGQPAMPYPQVQVYSVVGPRMVAPHQAIPMVPTSHSNTYPDNQHVHSQVFVSTHPPGPVPTPLPGPTPPHHAATPIQTIPAGPHSTPPNQQGPMPGQNQSGGGVHPNPSPVHQPPPHGAAPTQPTPPATVGTPQPLVYQQPHAAQLGQPPLQPSPHTPNSPQTIHPNPNQTLNHNPHLHHNPVSHASSSHGGPHITQTHPHHPGNPGPTGYPAAAAAHQSLVLIHQQAPTSALSAHPQPVPTGHTFQTSMHGPGTPGPVPHIMPSSMQLPVLPNTSGAATMPSHPPIHYIPQHALNVQLQLHPNHPCSRMLMPNEQANAKPHTWFVRLKQEPKGKKKQHE